MSKNKRVKIHYNKIIDHGPALECDNYLIIPLADILFGNENKILIKHFEKFVDIYNSKMGTNIKNFSVSLFYDDGKMYRSYLDDDSDKIEYNDKGYSIELYDLDNESNRCCVDLLVRDIKIKDNHLSSLLSMFTLADFEEIEKFVFTLDVSLFDESFKKFNNGFSAFLICPNNMIMVIINLNKLQDEEFIERRIFTSKLI